ncbi:hypothetical protein [Pantoea alhagi]|nr:hypothetical protein [Pantoea alhagi]
MKNKALLTLVLLSGLLLSGCSKHSTDMFFKYATFTFFDTYKTEVLYWQFKDGVRVTDKWNPAHFPVQVADNKSYVRFRIDMGGIYVGLPTINTDNIEKDTVPFRDFLNWAAQPYEKREKTKRALSESKRYAELDFRVENETGTNTPLLIITRKTGYFVSDLVIAMRPVDVYYVIAWANMVKEAKDKGTEL